MPVKVRAKEHEVDMVDAFGTELGRVRAGAATWAQCLRQTAGDWERMARYLLQRCRVPAAVGVEDVVQELQLHAWRYLPRWQPGRGATLGRFVVWNAMARTKRWLAVQAARRPGYVAPIPVPLSAVAHDPDDPGPELAVEPDQEGILEAVQSVRRVVARLRPEDRWCVLAAARHGGVVAGAAAVYGDPQVARLVAVGSQREAERVVRRALRRAAAVQEVG